MAWFEATITETITHKHWVEASNEDEAYEKVSGCDIGKVVNAEVIEVEIEETQVLEVA